MSGETARVNWAGGLSVLSVNLVIAGIISKCDDCECFLWILICFAAYVMSAWREGTGDHKKAD